MTTVTFHGHADIVKTTACLVELYWWPRRNGELNNVVYACDVCRRADKSAEDFTRHSIRHLA